MFIGHAAVAMAAKPLAPRANLALALAASYWLDIVWPVLVLAGIERVEIAPGDTAFTPMHFSHYPWSHSLAASLVWAVLFGAACWKLGRRTALVMGALVFSHWLLDALSHRADLPLWPGGDTFVGLGLWNSVAGTLVVEGGMFAAGLWIYVRSAPARDRIGAIAFWLLIAVFLAAYLGNVLGPPPPSVAAVAAVGIAGTAILLGLAGWADRHR
jgi:membrane-bound metal-dependent hydrolase YbcI (DUF457 family)